MTSHQMNFFLHSAATATPSAAAAQPAAAPLPSTSSTLPPPSSSLLSSFHTDSCIDAAVDTSVDTPAVILAAAASFPSSHQLQQQQQRNLSMSSSEPVPSSASSEDDEEFEDSDEYVPPTPERGNRNQWSVEDEAIVWKFGVTRERASKAGETPLTWSHCRLETRQRSGVVCRKKYMRMKAQHERGHQQHPPLNNSRTLPSSFSTQRTAATSAASQSPPLPLRHQMQLQQKSTPSSLLSSRSINREHKEEDDESESSTTDRSAQRQRQWSTEDEGALWKFGVVHDLSSKSGQKPIPWNRCPLIKSNRGGEACRQKYLNMKAKVDKVIHQRGGPNTTTMHPLPHTPAPATTPSARSSSSTFAFSHTISSLHQLQQQESDRMLPSFTPFHSTNNKDKDEDEEDKENEEEGEDAEDAEDVSTLDEPSSERGIRDGRWKWSAEDEAELWKFGVRREATSKDSEYSLTWSQCPLVTPQRKAAACNLKYIRMKKEAKAEYMHDTARHSPIGRHATDEANRSEDKMSDETEQKEEEPSQEETKQDEQIDCKPKWEFIPITHNAASGPSRRSLPASAAVEWCHNSIEALLEYCRTIDCDPHSKSRTGWDGVVVKIQSRFPAFAKWQENCLKKECKSLYRHLYDTNQLKLISITSGDESDVEMAPLSPEELKEDEEDNKSMSIVHSKQSRLDPPSLVKGACNKSAESYDDMISESSSEADIDSTQSFSPRITQEEHKSQALSHICSAAVAARSPTPLLDALIKASTSRTDAPMTSSHLNATAVPAVAAVSSESNMDVGGAMTGVEPSTPASPLPGLTSFNWSQMNRNIVYLNMFNHHYSGMVNVIKQMQQTQPYCYHAKCQRLVQETGVRPIYCDLHKQLHQ